MFNDKNKAVPYGNNLGIGTFRNEFDGLVDKLFDAFWSSPSFLTERNWRHTDINEDQNNLYIDVELPGFSKDQVKVEADNSGIKITAKNAKSSYVRTYNYNRDLDYSQSDVKLENGVLRITIPKTEQAKAKILEIK